MLHLTVFLESGARLDIVRDETIAPLRPLKNRGASIAKGIKKTYGVDSVHPIGHKLHESSELSAQII